MKKPPPSMMIDWLKFEQRLNDLLVKHEDELSHDLKNKLEDIFIEELGRPAFWLDFKEEKK